MDKLFRLLILLYFVTRSHWMTGQCILSKIFRSSLYVDIFSILVFAKTFSHKMAYLI